MPESKNVLVTGSTGFLGSHLVFRLLEQGHRVYALARDSKTASAPQRVEETLAGVAGSAQALRAVNDRLTVLAGDIADPGLGLAEAERRQMLNAVDEVWHCAASLSFAEEDRDEIFRTNVDATKNVIGLVEQTPSRRFQHVSTAYVAGNRPDVARESDIDVGQTFKNPYEESKC